jgi:AcrR family transcriptional regulator
MAARRESDLREACIREALAIIEAEGLENLSLREISRRLGVSHQAPYKHFPSRDHILAEIVRRAFEAFAAHLDARPQTDDPRLDLGYMGQAYFAYALAHPLQYRLMFGTPLPDPSQHPEMMRSGQHAFALLRDGIARMRQHDGDPTDDAERDALFVWSAVHGLATILQTEALHGLTLREDVVRSAVEHVLLRIGVAINAPPRAAAGTPATEAG